MKKASILLFAILISISVFAQTKDSALNWKILSKVSCFDIKKDTLIISNYEAIRFIKIADKVYKIQTELVSWIDDTSCIATNPHGHLNLWQKEPRFVGTTKTATRIETNPHITTAPYIPFTPFNFTKK